MATINGTKLSFKYVADKLYSALTGVNPQDIIFVAKENAIYVNGVKFGLSDEAAAKINSLETALAALKSFSKVAGNTGAAEAPSTNATLNIKGASGIATTVGTEGVSIAHTNSVVAGTAQGDANKTLTFGGTFAVPTVTYDAQGHITGKGSTTMTMPANPNTDTKVTSVANHYAPTADASSALAAEAGKYVSGVTRDAKGHVVGLTTTSLPAAATLVEGTTNGTVKFNGTDVAVHGLGSAAYTETSAYASAEQGTLAENAVPKTRKVNNKALSADVTLTGADVALTGYSKGTNTAVVASDTVNAAIGKLEGQIESVKTVAVGAMEFKGVVTELPTTANNGDVYVVSGKEYVYDSTKKAFEEFGDQSLIGQLETKVTALEARPGLDKEGTVTAVNATSSSDSHISVSGGGFTTSGTITIGVTSGYTIPANNDITKWNTAATTAGTAVQTVRAANTGTYISVAAAKSGTTINLTPSVTVQAMTSASASAKGLAEASDVKAYVDSQLTWEEL